MISLGLLSSLLWWASLTLLLAWGLYDRAAHRPLRRALADGRLASQPRPDGALRLFGGDDLATNPEIAYRYTRYQIARGEVGVLQGRLAPEADTYSLTLYDTLLQSRVTRGAGRCHARRAELPVDAEGRFVLLLAHEDPGWPFWLDLGEEPEGVLMERHFGGRPERPSTLDVVEASRLGELLVFVAAALAIVLAMSPASLARAGTLGEVLEATWDLRALRVDTDAPLLPEASYKAAAQGERRTGLLPGRGARPDHAWAVMVVPAPIDQVWAALGDEVGAAAELESRESYLLEGARCASGRTVLSFADLPAVKDRYWLVKMEENEVLQRASQGQLRELRWRPASVEPGALEEALAARIARSVEVRNPRGSWLLLALPGGRTLLEYHATTRVSRVAPMWLLSRIVRVAILNTLIHVRDFAIARRSRCGARPGRGPVHALR